jgi:NDP-sugar pyrophosphorylase family protein
VINGDTFPQIDLKKFLAFHNECGERKFISVATNKDGVSAGVYLFEKKAIQSMSGQESLENDVFPWADVAYMSGVEFVDIGTPESYFEARGQSLW